MDDLGNHRCSPEENSETLFREGKGGRKRGCSERAGCPGALVGKERGWGGDRQGGPFRSWWWGGKGGGETFWAKKKNPGEKFSRVILFVVKRGGGEEGRGRGPGKKGDRALCEVRGRGTGREGFCGGEKLFDRVRKSPRRGGHLREKGGPRLESGSAERRPTPRDIRLMCI